MTKGIKIRIYPNPFSDNTTILFELLQSEMVEIALYNQAGQKIEILHSRDYKKGIHQYVWEASELPDGLYFIHVKAGLQVKTMKIIKMR